MIIDRLNKRAKVPTQLGTQRKEDPFEIIDLIVKELTEEKRNLMRMASQESGREHILEQAISSILNRNGYHVEGMNREELEKTVFDYVTGYGPAEPYIGKDGEAFAFFINKPDDVWIQIGKKRIKLDIDFGSKGNVRRYIERITSNLKGEINEDQAMVKFHDERRKLRIICSIEPISHVSPMVVIRKQPENPYTMEDLLNMDVLSKKMHDDLIRYVELGLNIDFAGIQSSGKTTLMRAAAEYIPIEKRVAIMEDHPELILKRDNTLNWLTKKHEMGTRFGLDKLTNFGLLASTDVYVFGEIRDGDAFYFFNGAMAGNETLSTSHSPDARSTINRLRINMKMADVQMDDKDVLDILWNSIDIIVFMDKFTVVEILEVDNEKREYNTLHHYEVKRRSSTFLEGEFKVGVKPTSKKVIQRLTEQGGADCDSRLNSDDNSNVCAS